MTLIEIFDKTPVENIITTLALKPDRVILVGSESRKMRRALPAMMEILRRRGMETEIAIRSVKKTDLEATSDALQQIIAERPGTYVVDISGGDESTLLTVGVLLGSNATVGKNVSTFRMNITTRKGVMFRVSPQKEGRIPIERDLYDFSYNTQVYLTVEENALLHGGRVVESGMTLTPDDPILSDIAALWEISRRDSGGWNSKIGRLSGLVERYSDSEELYVIRDEDLGKGKNQFEPALWQEFLSKGLIRVDRGRSRSGLTVFTYKNRVVNECLNKAGSVLEYHTYGTALGIQRDGRPLFRSAAVSVVYAWDEAPDGTRNEIDCMLMCGMVPIFISCKNGDIKTDELYKLETVAANFGSVYAKKALLSTGFFDPASRSYCGSRVAATMKERADKQGIALISCVHQMSDGQLISELSRLA